MPMRAVALAALVCTACAGGIALPTPTGADSGAPQLIATPTGAAAASQIATPTVVASPTSARTEAVTPSAVVPPTAQRTPTAQPATPTPVRTVAPTPAPQTTPRTSGYTTLPPGSALPSEQQCASEIVRDTWEPRPENRTANLTNAWTSGFRLRGSYLASIAPGYEERVTGNFTGTTDEIIRWAACKWGFDENDVRAQAVIESYWRQSLTADCNVRSQPATNGCASVGLMSVKGADIPATHPGTWPAAMTSTAFNVDYTLAVRRLCYEGKETWLREFNASYAAGDVWGCIGRWFSGRWHDAGADSYIARVRTTMNARTWLSPTF